MQNLKVNKSMKFLLECVTFENLSNFRSGLITYILFNSAVFDLERLAGVFNHLREG